MRNNADPGGACRRESRIVSMNHKILIPHQTIYNICKAIGPSEWPHFYKILAKRISDKFRCDIEIYVERGNGDFNTDDVVINMIDIGKKPLQICDAETLKLNEKIYEIKKI